MTKKIYILVFTLLQFIAYSQIDKAAYTYLENKIPKEKVQLQINSNLLLVGEFLYYKTYNLYLQDNGLSPISKLNYVELIGKDKNIVFKHKLNVKNSSTQGDFLIPSTIPTGHYKLIAYTHWSLNNNTNSFCQKDIYIINPYTSKRANASQENEFVEIKRRTGINQDVINNPDISIKTNQNEYATRDKVTLTINNKLAPFENASLSIRKLDSIQIETINNQTKEYKTNYNYYLPELRGEILSGKIEAKNSNASPLGKVISLSIPGKDFIFKNAFAKKNGQFFFVLDQNYTNSNILIQIDDNDAKNYSISIDKLGFNAYDQLNFKSIKLNTSIKDWLKYQSINNQIENAYLQVKPDSIINTKKEDLFFHPKAIRYVLDDFNRFKTIKETFVEIIFASSIIYRNDYPEFVVSDYKNQEANNVLQNVNPLVLVDGVLITNNNDIINYNAYNLEAISIVTGHYIYGPKVYNGIISFKTKTNDFTIPSNQDHIKYVQLQLKERDKVYFKSNYSIDTESKRIPDFKTQLLWLPNIELRETTSIDFYTSDIKGVFEISLEGYTKSGKHIKTTSFFKVN